MTPDDACWVELHKKATRLRFGASANIVSRLGLRWRWPMTTSHNADVTVSLTPNDLRNIQIQLPGVCAGIRAQSQDGTSARRVGAPRQYVRGSSTVPRRANARPRKAKGDRHGAEHVLSISALVCTPEAFTPLRRIEGVRLRCPQDQSLHRRRGLLGHNRPLKEATPAPKCTSRSRPSPQA